MLPTPDTSHVDYERIYEPAEDSFLLLDTLSSDTETAFLRSRFGGGGGGHGGDADTNTAAGSSTPPPPAPLVVEIGPGSGVVIGFVNAHADTIFGTRHVLTAAVDVNRHACTATGATAQRAAAAAATTTTSGTTDRKPISSSSTAGLFLDAVQGDLAAPLRTRCVDVLIFNPPYVPTDELPRQPSAADAEADRARTTFDHDSYLLALSYAGGRDGMETTDRLIDGLADVLSARGCAYVLLCAQNRPEEVKQRIRAFGPEWLVETVGTSGKTAGWEKLQIIRIWRQ